MNNMQLAPLFKLSGGIVDIIPRSFVHASIIASAIVRSDLFADTLFNLYPVLNQNKVKKFIRNQFLKIDLKRIRDKLAQDAYAVVYPDQDPFSIYISTLLLMEMKEVENEHEALVQATQEEVNMLNGLLNEAQSIDVSTRKRDRTIYDLGLEIDAKNLALEQCRQKLNDVYYLHVLFLTVKLVHELAHIVNYQLNSKRNSKNKFITPEKTIDNHVYTDFGEMVEKTLFGGLVEHAQKPSRFTFAVSSVLSYEFKGSDEGYIVDITQNIQFFNIRSHRCYKRCGHLKIIYRIPSHPIKWFCGKITASIPQSL
jgi:hypothetical protein